MEEVARRAHPSLVVVDRAKNLYEIELHGVQLRNPTAAAGITSTKKTQVPQHARRPARLHRAERRRAQRGRRAEDRDTDPKDRVTITSTPALGGTGAQGGVNPFPGDVDMAESIKIVAPTADAAASALAAAIQATVTKATAPRADGKLGTSRLHDRRASARCEEARRKREIHVRADDGGRDELRQSARYGGGKGTLTLAQAIASPATSRQRTPIGAARST